MAFAEHLGKNESQSEASKLTEENAQLMTPHLSPNRWKLSQNIRQTNIAIQRGVSAEL